MEALLKAYGGNVDTGQIFLRNKPVLVLSGGRGHVYPSTEVCRGQSHRHERAHDRGE